MAGPENPAMDRRSHMEEQIIRDWATAERIERGLADYQARRSSGIACPDLRPAHQRNQIESLHVQRLNVARQFVQALRH